MSMTEDYAHEPKMITMYDDVILVWRDEVEDDDQLFRTYFLIYEIWFFKHSNCFLLR